jgi:hypothetical protein
MAANTVVRELIVGGGTNYFSIATRANLEEETFQKALRREKDRKSILGCGCKEAENVWPSLLCREILCKRFLVCARGRIRQHGSGCIFESIYQDQPILPLSGSMFAPTVGDSARSPDGSSVAGDGIPNVNCPPFQTFICRTAAKAGTDVFVSVDSVSPPIVQPSTDQFFKAWASVLNAKTFRGSRSAFETARREGVELVIGIVFVDPIPRPNGPTLVTGHWWSGRTLRAVAFSAAASVLHEGMGRLRGLRGVLPPPYLCAAAVEPDGTVRHIWFLGIWTDGQHLVFTASGTERSHTARIRAKGGIIYVPLLDDDLDRLAPILPRTKCQITWRYKPDAVIWWPDSEHPGVPDVVEVRGFKPGSIVRYDTDFDVKVPWYGTLGQCYRFVLVEGWQLEDDGRSFRRNEWLNPPLERGWFTPAGLKVWTEQIRRMRHYRADGGASPEAGGQH